MNTDPENFEQLRKLLALKKHEQPPPAYFDNLPNQIWSRIEKESAAPAESFWNGFLTKFVLRPTVAYSFALVVCATLIVGIGASLNNDDQPGASSTSVVQQQNPAGLTVGNAALAKELGGTNNSSTNPVIPPPNIQLQVTPVSY